MSISKYKILSADITTGIFLLFVLLRNYSTIGLIFYLASLLFLFLVTLIPSGERHYLFSNKINYYLFGISISLFGTWLPFILKYKYVKYFDPKHNITQSIVLLVISIFCISVSSTFDKTKLIPKTILKYISMILFFASVYSFCDLRFEPFYLFVLVAVVFCVTEIYTSLYQVYECNTFYSNLNKNHSGLIAFFICGFFCFAEIYSMEILWYYAGTYEYLTALINDVFSGAAFWIFIVLMIVLTVLCVIFDENTKYFDSYFALSFLGFMIAFKMFASNCNVNSLIVLISTAILFLIFGFSMFHKVIRNKKHSLDFLITKNYTPLIISVIITIISIFSIKLVSEGYIYSWIILFAFVTVTLIIKSNLHGNWIKNNIFWQSIIITIFVFTVSISATKGTLPKTLLLNIISLLVFSIFLWTFSIRDNVLIEKNKNYNIIKIIDCSLCGLICVISAI